MASLIMIYLAMALSMQGMQGPLEELPVQDLSDYKLAGLKLRNTEPLSSDYLRAVIPLKNGEPFNIKPIKETLEQIQRLYRDLGFLDFAYNPHFDIDHGQKTVLCSFDFIRGTRYHVNRIEVFGAGSDEEENEIKSALILKEESLFSPAAFYDSHRGLKLLLESKNLNLKDYEYKRSSDYPGTVDISIRIQSVE